MQGCLRLHAGVLYVGRHALTAEVASYDFDGRPLETRFRFRDDAAGRSSADGLDVDEDRRIWVADAAAHCVRCFSLFGVEVARVGDGDGPDRDRRGSLGRPVDVRVVGSDDSTTVLVASGGRRRHALQILHVATGRGRSLAPLGDPEGRFERIRSLDARAGRIAICEASAARVQLFDGDPLGRVVFRSAFRVPQELGTPEAVALVGDGRVLVATSGDRFGLHLFHPDGGHLRALAGEGAARGGAEVEAPSAVAVEERAPGGAPDGEGRSPLGDRQVRVAVLDRDGERVQVLSLDGRPFGEFPALGTIGARES